MLCFSLFDCFVRSCFLVYVQ